MMGQSGSVGSLRHSACCTFTSCESSGLGTLSAVQTAPARGKMHGGSSDTSEARGDPGTGGSAASGPAVPKAPAEETRCMEEEEEDRAIEAESMEARANSRDARESKEARQRRAVSRESFRAPVSSADLCRRSEGRQRLIRWSTSHRLLLGVAGAQKTSKMTAMLRH